MSPGGEAADHLVAQPQLPLQDAGDVLNVVQIPRHQHRLLQPSGTAHHVQQPPQGEASEEQRSCAHDEQQEEETA